MAAPMDSAPWFGSVVWLPTQARRRMKRGDDAWEVWGLSLGYDVLTKVCCRERTAQNVPGSFFAALEWAGNESGSPASAYPPVFDDTGGDLF